MKATGIIRPLDTVGRIVLPKEIRKQFDLVDDRDSLEIFTDNDTIILRKYSPSCIFCGEDDGLIEFKGKKICKNCKKEIRKA